MNLSRQFTKREKVLLVLLAALMLAAGYYLAVFRPVSDALSRLRDEQSMAEAELTVLEAKAAVCSQMRTELETILADPGVSPIPSYNNLEQLTAYLNTLLSSATGYDLSFQQAQMPESADIVRRTISMTFTCPTYDQARDVALALRGSPYRCQLSDLSFAAAKPEGAAADQLLSIQTEPVEVTLTVTFFESLR